MKTKSSPSGYRYWKSLALDDRQTDLHSGVERALEHGAGLHVPELRAHERAALARLHVLELDDLEQHPVELEGHAVLEIVRGNAHSSISSREAIAEHAAPVGRDLDHVLDARAAQPGHVDARLHGDDRPRRKRVLGELATEPRPLVDVEADAVAEPVGEGIAVPGARDHVSGRGVDVRAGHAFAHGVDARLLGLAHGVVDLPELGGGLAEGDRARHVGVVAAEQRAEVQLDDVALLEGAVVRARGEARPRSRRTPRSTRTTVRRRRHGAAAPRADAPPAARSRRRRASRARRRTPGRSRPGRCSAARSPRRPSPSGAARPARRTATSSTPRRACGEPLVRTRPSRGAPRSPAGGRRAASISTASASPNGAG